MTKLQSSRIEEIVELFRKKNPRSSFVFHYGAREWSASIVCDGQKYAQAVGTDPEKVIVQFFVNAQFEIDILKLDSGRKLLKEGNDVMPVNEFLEQCQDGVFTDYDGYGYWATDKEYDDVLLVLPSSIMALGTAIAWNKPEWATHVVWFNK